MERYFNESRYFLSLLYYFCLLFYLQKHSIKGNEGRVNKTKEKRTPWPESARELYQPSDHRLSAKSVPTFADRGVSRSQRGGSPYARNLVFYTEPATFSFE
jgi:hypothetical protein